MEETEKKQKKKRWTKILGLSLVLFAVFIILLQIYFGVSQKRVTEIATVTVADARVELQGLSVKNVTVIEKSGTGVVYYVAEDGSRVAKDQVIGYLCNSEEEVNAFREMDRLEKHIQLLKEAGENVALVNTQYETLTTQMNRSIVEMVADLTTGDLNNLDQTEQDYIPASARRELAVNEATSFDATIASLTDRLNNLKKSFPSQGKVIKAPIAGYFSRGGSLSVSPEKAENMTVDRLLEALNQPISEAIGVISPDYVWSYIGITKKENIGSLQEGMSVKLDFSKSDGSRLPATVAKIELDGDYAIIRASCNYIDREVVASDYTSVGLILNTYQGICISKSSLHFEGAVPGVYVVGQQQIKFKKVNILYENDNIVVCEMNTDDAEYLRLFDEIVVKGTDLYDGKPA